MDELYKIQNVTYNATGGTLKNDKAVIDLTAQQNRLLHYLVLNAGQTLTKEQITAHVWGYDVDSDVSNLIYDTVSAVRRLLKKAGLNGAVTTKTGIGYAFTESVEKIKPTAAKTEETCESLPPVFAESATKFTLDTVYLLLMGDSMYKKAWFLQSVGYIEKLPPLSLEPGSADTVAEDAFYSWILPESIWARILCTYPEESNRRAEKSTCDPCRKICDIH